MVGRKEELSIVQDCLLATQSDFIALHGRRRVGKTYFVRNAFKENIFFEMSGLYEGTNEQHLQNFAYEISKQLKKKIKIPLNWMEAFHFLTNEIDRVKTKKKIVLFFDELPWLSVPRSGFLQAIDYLWNQWATKKTNIILVICGSSSSWMIKNVIRNRGGLHNRVTKRIHLMPFTLAETEAFLLSKRVRLDRYQIIQLYMVMGGIPHYLKEVRPGKSAAQIIDALCFGKQALLRDEFQHLYKAIFSNASMHEHIVRALAKINKGINRRDLLAATGLPNAGSTTRLLEELEQCGFITKYPPFGKKMRDSLYRISDNYSAFYLRFIENAKLKEAGSWIKKSTLPSWTAYSGFAFENVCLQHTRNIKMGLQISGVYSEESAWIHKGSKEEQGAQIDMVIDRNDRIINVCEMKFARNIFTIDKKYAAALQQMLAVFKNKTQTRKSVFLVFISPYGVVKNEHYLGLVQEDITIDALFT